MDRPPLYSGVEIGWPIIVTCDFGMVALAVGFAVSGLPEMLWAMAPLLAVTLLFGIQTNEVWPGEVRVRLGIGLIGKTWRLGEVREASVVRRMWIEGWGIRWNLGNRWTWAVSGLDAVELHFADGGVLRIGTAKPAEMLDAINAARGR